MKKILFAIFALMLLSKCGTKPEKTIRNFSEDFSFLKAHCQTILLTSADSLDQLVIVPEYQGRVMTSTAEGSEGFSFGWINYELIQSGETLSQMNPFGGEDRFWLGPEGGQYAIFFESGDEFNLQDWQTPAEIDTELFQVVSQNSHSARFSKKMSLVNYSETEFNLEVDRTIELLTDPQISADLAINIPATVSSIGFTSRNSITNIGDDAWTKEGGLLSIWILGMFKPSDATTVVIPYQDGSSKNGLVNDAYFGQVPEDRLKTGDEAIYFLGDGKYRSKIGLKQAHATGILGSYDAINQILTIVKYTQPDTLTDYVNSMWEMQEFPYGGDVINSYNDGPPEPGKEPLGPFYELETSSPAAALQPGESMNHQHTTFHFQGDESALNEISISILGVSLEQIKSQFTVTN